jgi:hypothetical protein
LEFGGNRGGAGVEGACLIEFGGTSEIDRIGDSKMEDAHLKSLAWKHGEGKVWVGLWAVEEKQIRCRIGAARIFVNKKNKIIRYKPVWVTNTPLTTTTRRGDNMATKVSETKQQNERSRNYETSSDLLKSTCLQCLSKTSIVCSHVPRALTITQHIPVLNTRARKASYIKGAIDRKSVPFGPQSDFGTPMSLIPVPTSFTPTSK